MVRAQHLLSCVPAKLAHTELAFLPCLSPRTSSKSARLNTVVSVFRCSGPSTFCRPRKARSKRARANVLSPRCWRKPPRLFSAISVSGCSGPSTFSRPRKARSNRTRACLWHLIQIKEYAPKVIHYRQRIWVFGPQRLLSKSQDSLQQGSRLRPLAYVPKKVCEVIHYVCCTWVIGAQRILGSSQRSLVHDSRLCHLS